jgi:hypothetical protein
MSATSERKLTRSMGWALVIQALEVDQVDYWQWWRCKWAGVYCLPNFEHVLSECLKSVVPQRIHVLYHLAGFDMGELLDSLL